MMKTLLHSLIVISLLAVSLLVPMGCGDRAKKDQAAEKLANEIEEIGRQNHEEMQSELDQGGSYSMRTERVDRLVDAYEKSADDLPDELHAQMAQQVKALKEIKQLAVPYEQAYNQFIATGGLDPSTMTDEEDIQRRTDLLRVMYDENEKIDKAFPAIFARLGADPDEAEAQLDLVRKIRQTDRDMIPHMIGAMEILKKHWAVSEMGDDEMFYFGAEVPAEDIAAYNEHIEGMNAAAQEQQRLQQLQLQP